MRDASGVVATGIATIPLRSGALRHLRISVADRDAARGDGWLNLALGAAAAVAQTDWREVNFQDSTRVSASLRRFDGEAQSNCLDDGG